MPGGAHDKKHSQQGEEPRPSPMATGKVRTYGSFPNRAPGGSLASVLTADLWKSVKQKAHRNGDKTCAELRVLCDTAIDNCQPASVRSLSSDGNWGFMKVEGLKMTEPT